MEHSSAALGSLLQPSRWTPLPGVTSPPLRAPTTAGTRPRVYSLLCTWGEGRAGALGHGKARANEVAPRVCVHLVRVQPIRAVTCGASFTLIVAADGTVHGCGELPDAKSRDVPEACDQLRGVEAASVAGGDGRCAACASDGRLFAWGTRSEEAEPTRSPAAPFDGTASDGRGMPLQAIAVACGSLHTLALSSSGRVFSWGLEGLPQTGRSLAVRAPHPKHKAAEARVPELRAIAAVAAGSFHSAAVSGKGRLYVFGDNGDGQLGLGRVGGAVHEPTRVPSLLSVPVRRVACGGHFTALVIEGGALLTFGDNAHGQLGHGGYESTCVPQPVRGLGGVPMMAVSCGYSHAVAQSSLGTLHAWGSNGSGELGIGDESGVSCPLPSQLPVLGTPGVEIVGISCGGFHTAAIVRVRRGLLPALAGSRATELLDEHTRVVASSGAALPVSARDAEAVASPPAGVREARRGGERNSHATTAEQPRLPSQRLQGAGMRSARQRSANLASELGRYKLKLDSLSTDELLGMHSRNLTRALSPRLATAHSAPVLQPLFALPTASSAAKVFESRPGTRQGQSRPCTRGGLRPSTALQAESRPGTSHGQSMRSRTRGGSSRPVTAAAERAPDEDAFLGAYPGRAGNNILILD